MSNVIEARALTKAFGNTMVVRGIDFQIKSGECFGILGPNGAGKTSTMRMMYCASPVTSGEVSVLGLNVKDQGTILKSRVGIVPQEDGLDPDFTVYDNLYLYSIYHSLKESLSRPRIEQLLDLMKLQEHRNFRVEQLSGGLRRRLTIARALLTEPEVIFLDEPTTGLDPGARLLIWDMLTQMKREGKTFVLTTHYMEEAEKMCDRTAIMDHGKILAIGSPQSLIREHIGHDVVEFVFDPKELEYLVKRIEPIYKYQVINTRIYLYLSEKQNPKEAMELLPHKNVLIRPASLGDVFLKLAGYDLRD